MKTKKKRKLKDKRWQYWVVGFNDKNGIFNPIGGRSFLAVSELQAVKMYTMESGSDQLPEFARKLFAKPAGKTEEIANQNYKKWDKDKRQGQFQIVIVPEAPTSFAVKKSPKQLKFKFF